MLGVKEQLTLPEGCRWGWQGQQSPREENLDSYSMKGL